MCLQNENPLSLLPSAGCTCDVYRGFIGGSLHPAGGKIGPPWISLTLRSNWGPESTVLSLELLITAHPEYCLWRGILSCSIDHCHHVAVTCWMGFYGTKNIHMTARIQCLQAECCTVIHVIHLTVSGCMHVSLQRSPEKRKKRPAGCGSLLRLHINDMGFSWA